MSDAKKWELKKVDSKNYGVYTFLLIVIGYLTEKFGLTLGGIFGGMLDIFGRVLMVIGVCYFFMWIWHKFKKQKDADKK